MIWWKVSTYHRLLILLTLENHELVWTDTFAYLASTWLKLEYERSERMLKTQSTMIAINDTIWSKKQGCLLWAWLDENNFRLSAFSEQNLIWSEDCRQKISELDMLNRLKWEVQSPWANATPKSAELLFFLEAKQV